MPRWVEALLSAFEPPAITMAREAIRSSERAALRSADMAREEARWVAAQRRSALRHRARVARAMGVMVSVPKITKEKTQCK